MREAASRPECSLVDGASGPLLGADAEFTSENFGRVIEVAGFRLFHGDFLRGF